jgi:multiple sugar transport system substrate-binding protein
MLAVLCLAGLIPGLVFGNGSAESTPKKESLEAGPTHVRIWTTDRHDAVHWTAKVDEYNKTNKDNIDLSYEIYTDNYMQAVDMAFQTGEAPDAFKFDNPFIKYINEGKCVDLLPLMSDQDKETFKSVMFEGHNLIDGHLYYIPSGDTCLRLFYNTAIFDRLGLKVPTTLEEMVACAKIITEKLSSEGIYGFACNLKNPTSGLKRSMEPMNELSTGIYFGYNFSSGRYEFEKYEPVITLWKEMMKYAFPGCESLDIDPLRAQFAAGKIGMYLSYTHAEPGVYANQFPLQPGTDWGCAQIPVQGGNLVSKQYFNVTPAFLINKDTKHLKETWKAYHDVFLNLDNLKEHFEKGLGISMIPAVIQNAEMGEKYKTFPAMLQGERDGLWPLTPEEKYSKDFIVEGANYFDTFASMIFGQTDIKKGLKDLSTRYNKALDGALKAGNKPIVEDVKF